LDAGGSNLEPNRNSTMKVRTNLKAGGINRIVVTSGTI
jgi:hypothetical protein